MTYQERLHEADIALTVHYYPQTAPGLLCGATGAWSATIDTVTCTTCRRLAKPKPGEALR